MIQMNVNFESIEKAWFKPKNEIKLTMKTDVKNFDNLLENIKYYAQYKYVLDELEEWLKKICEQEFVFEDGYDYCTERAYGCKVCLDKIQELKKEMK